MRVLLGCPNCKRQYDASALPVGGTFRCRCGQAIPVPKVTAHDAAVVRCSSCGGPRQAGALSCPFCGADFTLHEQDLETICPSCLARISDHAKFCHSCGEPIAPEDTAGQATDRSCPACGKGHTLRSRRVGDASVSLLECDRCAGLWVSEDVFMHLSERARKTEDPAPDPAALRTETRAPHAANFGSIYRRCPVCATVMNRTNFGRRSGVIVDRCRDHGIWFDASELDAVLRWIRSGGETLSKERDQDEARQAASAARFRVEPKAPEEERGGLAFRGDDEDALLPALVRMFFGK